MRLAEDMEREAAAMSGRAAGFRMTGDRDMARTLDGVAADLFHTASRLRAVTTREAAHSIKDR